MRVYYQALRLLIAAILLLHRAAPAAAQGENNNWCFGNGEGFAFQPAGPVWRSSSISTSENTSAISDAQGRLLFYTNGTTIWDRQHQPMTNACPTCDGARTVLRSTPSAAQGALIVQRPGSSSVYYVFATDAQENQFAGGFTYTEVDMTLRGGLGGVTAVQNVRLPTPTSADKVREGVAGMQHANRRDVWVLVHALTSNTFYCFLVTPAGVDARPVSSRAGSADGRLNIAKFSPDGRRLARCGLLGAAIELFDFDSATGQVSNALDLPALSDNHMTVGLDFSPDGTKLYQAEAPAFRAAPSSLQQYDLSAGSPAAILGSRETVGLLPGWNGMSLGPDGRLYCSSMPQNSVVDRPNRRGSAVNYFPPGASNRSNACLQNVVRPQPPLLNFQVETSCVGSPVRFQPDNLPAGAGPLTWTFYNPATGVTDSTQGPSTTRTYPTPGTYRVTLSAVVRGQIYRTQRYVVVYAAPVAQLPADTLVLCGGRLLLQLPAPAAGHTIRWFDGSTGTSVTVSEPGPYWVEVRNALGCVAADTVVVTSCPLPNIITPNGDGRNDSFRLLGLAPGVWTVEIYNRWGRQVYRQPQYADDWDAAGQPAGTYYYLLTHPRTGQHLRGYVEVVR